MTENVDFVRVQKTQNRKYLENGASDEKSMSIDSHDYVMYSAHEWLHSAWLKIETETIPLSVA